MVPKSRLQAGASVRSCPAALHDGAFFSPTRLLRLRCHKKNPERFIARGGA